MKFSIIVVIATLVFAFAAHFLLQDPGYVAINFRGYLVEMSVPVLLGIAVTLVVAVWAIRRVIIAPRLIGEAAGRYRAGRAGQKLTRGMIEVAEGNYARGEKMLARAASTSDAPLLNYLQAARAAHLQGKDERRDEWLKLAYEHTPAATNAVLLTQAELQLDREQYEQALATLRRIEENSRDHSYALGLIGKLYYRLEDWDNLDKLLPRLKAQGRITSDTIRMWTVRVHREHLDRAQDGDAVQAAWKNVPRNLRAADVEILHQQGIGIVETLLENRLFAAQQGQPRRLQLQCQVAADQARGIRREQRPGFRVRRCHLDEAGHGLLDRTPGPLRGALFFIGRVADLAGSAARRPQWQRVDHPGKTCERQCRAFEVRLFHRLQRRQFFRQRAPHVGKRRVRHLHYAFVGHLERQHREPRVVAELQLRVGDLHVVLGLGEQPGIACARGRSLHRRNGILEVRHAPGERIEHVGTLLEFALQVDDTGFEGLVARYQAVQAVVEAGQRLP